MSMGRRTLLALLHNTTCRPIDKCISPDVCTGIRCENNTCVTFPICDDGIPCMLSSPWHIRLSHPGARTAIVTWHPITGTSNSCNAVTGQCQYEDACNIPGCNGMTTFSF
jgi:hypothetical protein